MNPSEPQTYRQNERLELAFNFVQFTGKHLFLTGKAGTGKTTFLRRLRELSPKRMIVVAPTGVAAIQAGGVTIHSFFQLSFGPQLPQESVPDFFPAVQNEAMAAIKRFSKEKINIIRSLELLVIDEISMVRADLLDAIDGVLRRFRNRSKPFGGVQLLMIGDLQQLAPIVKPDEWALLQPYYDSPFFFSSRALRQSAFTSIELTEIFRQRDDHFIGLLNKVRENKLDNATLELLNQRYQPGFDPTEEEGYITLTTHNHQSQQINRSRLMALGTDSAFFEAELKGEFPDYAFPTDANLELKTGSQVMFVKNDSSFAKRYFNGKIGRIAAIDEGTIRVECPGEGQHISVEREVWHNCRYTLNPASQEIEEEVIGSFTQFPLRLAWAITIHKSQGLTFDKAIIDARDSFAHGQVYVALSRCRTLEGLVLRTPIYPRSVKSDQTVVEFTGQVEQHQPGEQELIASRKEYFAELIANLYDFTPLMRPTLFLLKLWKEHESIFIGSQGTILRTMADQIREQLMTVSDRFGLQVRQLLAQTDEPEQSEPLQERIRKASGYFLDTVQQVVVTPMEDATFACDNKLVKKTVLEAWARLDKETELVGRCLEATRSGFSIQSYLQTRARAVLEVEEQQRKGRGVPKQGGLSDNPDLYNRLKSWRAEQSELLMMRDSQILPQKTMLEIVQTLPDTAKALKAVKGMGGTRMKQFGREILSILLEYRRTNGLELPGDALHEVERAGFDSRHQTLELFRSGMSIPEIARSRQLANSTIEQHLLYGLSEGVIPIGRLLSEDRLQEIQDCMEHHKARSVSALRTYLGEHFSYAEIRFALKYFEKG